MLVAVAALSLMDAAMKWLAPHYPPLQVAALRGAASLPLVAGWVALSPAGPRQVLRVRWGLQLLRGVFAVVMLTSFVLSVRALPLADAYSIFFISPLLITALSALLLGEHVDARRWAAIGAGMAGVLVVLRPTGSGMLTLYFANPTWGAPADYLKALLWGSTVSEGLKYVNVLLRRVWSNP